MRYYWFIIIIITITIIVIIIHRQIFSCIIFSPPRFFQATLSSGLPLLLCFLDAVAPLHTACDRGAASRPACLSLAPVFSPFLALLLDAVPTFWHIGLQLHPFWWQARPFLLLTRGCFVWQALCFPSCLSACFSPPSFPRIVFVCLPSLLPLHFGTALIFSM